MPIQNNDNPLPGGILWLKHWRGDHIEPRAYTKDQFGRHYHEDGTPLCTQSTLAHFEEVARKRGANLIVGDKASMIRRVAISKVAIMLLADYNVGAYQYREFDVLGACLEGYSYREVADLILLWIELGRPEL